MESICQEIGVPRKQIKETKRIDRHVVIVHRAWLSCLVQEKCVAKFPCHPGFDEWPTTDDGCGRDWTLTYFVVSALSFDSSMTKVNSVILWSNLDIQKTHT